MNKGGTTNIVDLSMLRIDVRLEGPGRMFDPRPLFFNLFYACCLLTCSLKALVACSILVLYFLICIWVQICFMTGRPLGV